MSAAVHRSERHGSINWGREGGEGTLHHTVSKADFKVGPGLRKTGCMIGLWSWPAKNKYPPSPQDQ